MNTYVYDFLTNLNLQWDRTNKNEIYVAILGYKTSFSYDVMNVLSPYGFICLDMEYDTHSMKTYMKFKHK